MTPEEAVKTLEELRNWIRSAGVPGYEQYPAPDQADADEAIRTLLEERDSWREQFMKLETSRASCCVALEEETDPLACSFCGKHHSVEPCPVWEEER